MESIQATFQTSKNNILQAYSIGNTHHKKGSNIKKYLSHKTYNEFKGETTIYDYVIEKRAFNRFLNKESESGIWWPTGAPCDVRIFMRQRKVWLLIASSCFMCSQMTTETCKLLTLKNMKTNTPQYFF